MQMTSAYKALNDTAAQFSARILCSNLSRRDTWVADFAVFVPLITYTLPVSHHSPKRLNKLQSAATRATLMKLGFNRNTARRVVYGPSRHGGLGFRDLFVEQGIGQVEMLVRHLRAKSTQGTLIRITLAWWKLVVGVVSSPLLETTSTSIPHLAPPWMSSMHSFLTQMDASIHIEGLIATLPQPLRENDDCIMDVILSLPNISKSHLHAFKIGAGSILGWPTFLNSVLQTAPASHATPGKDRAAGCHHSCDHIKLAQDRPPFGSGDDCLPQRS
jgi:hypothetical protein